MQNFTWSVKDVTWKKAICKTESTKNYANTVNFNQIIAILLISFRLCF